MSARLKPAQPPHDLIILSCDDNLVFAHETLGRLWRLTGWPWAANENRPKLCARPSPGFEIA